MADGQAYVVYAPQTCDLIAFVQVAGTRWRIEQAFEMAKQDVGLDEYEVRSATGWTRHVTLVLWALALLSVVRTGTQSGGVQTGPRPECDRDPPPAVAPRAVGARTVACILAWSLWRRQQRNG